MAGDRHFRRWLAVAAGIACALGVLLLWLWPREPAPAKPVVADGDGRASGMPPRPAAGAVPAAPAATAPAAPASSGREASIPLLQQLAGVHAIASQVEVSTRLQQNADQAAKTVERYCERARAFREHPPFTGQERRRDAGLFLAPLVDWYTGPGPAPGGIPQRIGRLHLPASLTARVRAAGERWPSVLSRADAAGLDFGWMREALGYDFWSLTSAGPIAEQAGNADLFYVIPEYSLLLRWSKLRYIAALSGGDLAEAKAEVDHLALLVHTSGGSIADDIAARMLGLATTAGLVQGAGLDAAAIKELRELGLAGSAYFWPGVPPEVMHRAVGCAPSPCASMVDAALMRQSLGGFSPEQTDAEFWSLAERSGCDGALLAAIRTARPQGSIEARSMVNARDPLPLERFFGP